ncbi:MFS transporter [Bifidobacterium phasiani]|uniref:MFS transporter n=1 Tax=Bifidobacterium phasiani TaxID=2834431 RepID=A0ABS6WBT3_9BIFI|nr:MFS transporter [Bifidobacterium phasiani]MBW3083630.1 MFS transporter [Bifidobacterium phasiani]
MDNANVRLSLREKLSYGASDCAYNLIFNVVTMYMMFYYTDVVGISLASVGTLFLAVRVLDAVAGPVVGALIDKTNTKWGKVRPWFLWFAGPFALIGVMTFTVPDFGGVAQMVYVYITYILMNFLAVSVTTPVTAILPNLTTNTQERVNTGAFRSIGGQVGVILSGALTLPLVNLLGRGDQRLGFTLTMIVYGVVCAALLLMTFANTRERVITPKEQEPPFLDSLKAMLRNRPWWILTLLNFVIFIGVVVKSSSIVYFFKYNLGSEMMSSLANTVNSAGMIVGMLLVPLLARRLKNRNIAILFFAIGIGGALLLFVGEQLGSVPFILFAIAVTAFSQAGQSTVFVMLADVVDYGEWKTGVRSQGLITACAAIGTTCGAGIAGWLGTFILDVNGFVANQEQTASALGAISFNFVWLPAICSAIAIVLMLMYKVDYRIDSIREELAARKH